MKKILIVEPFYGGSHRQWADGWKKHSRHQIEIVGLSDHNWKWRMHGGAVTLARKVNQLKYIPDHFVVSDMLDLTTFKSLLNQKFLHTKFTIYFHENQLTYPWSPTDEDINLNRDNHYKFINYVSALAADKCLFNSSYNMNSFLGALPLFLNIFPDHRNHETVNDIRQKSHILPLGLDLNPIQFVAKSKKSSETLSILWNHRWEYDKNPEAFFSTLFRLQDEHIPFSVIVLGEKGKRCPDIFIKAKKRLASHILHWGYCTVKTDYYKWVSSADLLPVTSNQDFFGGSVIEAVALGVYPIIPKRLAYEEHFSDFPEVYYETSEELYQKLKNQLIAFNPQNTIRHEALKYDWLNLIKRYDDTFE